jgi:hypothetical protein
MAPYFTPISLSNPYHSINPFSRRNSVMECASCFENLIPTAQEGDLGFRISNSQFRILHVPSYPRTFVRLCFGEPSSVPASQPSIKNPSAFPPGRVPPRRDGFLRASFRPGGRRLRAKGWPGGRIPRRTLVPLYASAHQAVDTKRHSMPVSITLTGPRAEASIP